MVLHLKIITVKLFFRSSLVEMITRPVDKNRPWDEIKQCDRCQGVAVKTGQQCKRSTCKIAQYCFSHLKTVLGLEVKDTERFGRGLFTKIPRKRGDTICNYDGNHLSAEELDLRYPINSSKELSTYVLQVTKNLFLDARSTQSCVGRYINSCDSNKGICNARFSVYKKQVTIKATKNIKPNEQIFIAYGPNYKF